MFAGSGYSNDDVDNNDEYDDTIPNNDEFMTLNWSCATKGCKSIVEDTEYHYFQRVNFLNDDAYKELYSNYLIGRVWCVGCLAKRGLFK